MESPNHTTAPSRPSQSSKKRRSRLRFGYVMLSIVIVALSVTAGIFYKKYSDLKRDPQIAANQETQQLIKSVGVHIELPKDETPTIATVQDKNKLKDQPFFASVENDDKILIYTKGRKAIIYRPGADKVINVGPIAISSQEQGDKTKAEQ